MDSSVNTMPIIGIQRFFLVLNLLAFLHMILVSCSESPISYSEHCDLLVPEATPSIIDLPFPAIEDGFYKGGGRSVQQYGADFSFSNYSKLLLFYANYVYKTDVEDIYQIKATLILHTSPYYRRSVSPWSDLENPGPGTLSFDLLGFWSKSAGNLCLMGTGPTSRRKDKEIGLSAVILRMYGFTNSSELSSLVKGTLESLSSQEKLNYFEPISLLVFPKTNCRYTKVLNDFDYGGAVDVLGDLSLSLPPGETACSVFTGQFIAYELEYARNCASGAGCSPFGEDVGYLPQIMTLSRIKCSQDNRSMSFLVEFLNDSVMGYYRTFSLDETLVGEGSWDVNKNQLRVVACRILGTTSSLNNSHIEDCSIRMSFRFPKVWTIRSSSSIMGQIWSDKSANASGYFQRITFRVNDKNWAPIKIPQLEVKYEYTEIDRVESSCSVNKSTKNKGATYPDAYSRSMSFSMSVENSWRRIGWGYSSPISVAGRISQRFQEFSSYRLPQPVRKASSSNGMPIDISYKISFTQSKGVNFNWKTSTVNDSLSAYSEVKIHAEGIYDPETGSLCMAGCKYLGSINRVTNDSMDCKVLINFQFPPVNSRTEVHIIGGIKSMRETSDPLYFAPLSLSGYANYPGQTRSFMLRMDFEIVMAMVSKTLACIFIVFQFLHVKKRLKVLSFTSVLMLCILALGYMVPLLLNFEAMFSRKDSNLNLILSSGGWLEMNEIVIRIITMIDFLMQFRLLQLTVSLRNKDGNQDALWISEKKAMSVLLLLYTAGVIVALFFKQQSNNFLNFSNASNINKRSDYLWQNLTSYAGLIIDGFLLPQILFNMFHNSKEFVLSSVFYLGITFLRLMPHAYDLYRARNSVKQIGEVTLFVYAKPGSDFYSTDWDITILSMGVLFAVTIHLQQHFGGCFFLPKKYRQQLQEYEKVPVVSEI